MRENATSLPLLMPAHEPFLSGLRTGLLGRTALVVLGSTFIALCAHLFVPLPWTPVPMTMQPFAVLLVGLLLGPALGATAVALYLLEGVTGLPVLVPGFGGLLPLGPSAGYLLSYPVVAALVGFLFARRSGFFGALAACLAGEAVILAGGASWLSVFTHGSAHSVFALAVAPFLAGDAVKIILASAIAAGTLGIYRRRGNGTDSTAKA